MKKENWLLSMNNIDDKYIEEAKPSSIVKFRRNRNIIVLAASIAVMFALSLLLFIPFSTEAPPMTEYSDSEYYEVIEKLNQYYFVPPKYKNAYELLVGGLTNFFKAATKNAGAENGYDFVYSVNDSDPMLDASVGAYDTSSKDHDESYEEVTDNQVKGVIEGDLFKRSDKYIYYYNCGNLVVYSIDGENSKEIGFYPKYYGLGDKGVLYLSEDCKTVTLITYYSYRYGKNNSFLVSSLDVSDPKNIVDKNTVEYEGEYVSSRMVDGKLYIIGNYYADEPDNYKNAETFVPSYTTVDGNQIISSDSIYCPDLLSSSGYTVLTKLDEETLNVEADYALLSFYNPVIFTSKDSFYFVRNYNDKKENLGYTVYEDMCEICRIDYSGEGFENMGSVFVEGNVNNQYSLDEHDGILRVFTSTDKTVSWQTELGNYGLSNNDTGRNASLFCIDINTLKVVSSVEKFAPKGENVKSARFDGDTAYVCTAVEFTDPVYFFDLSDLDKITYKETGTVEGFSTSLVDFGDGYLLGIGQKDWGTPKIEIYKESGDKVISVSAIEIPNSQISSDYKAYYIDRENGYIGLVVSSYVYGKGHNYRYVIFKFQNEELSVAYEFAYSGKSSDLYAYTDTVRGTFIEEFVYVVSAEGLKVIHESVLK